MEINVTSDVGDSSMEFGLSDLSSESDNESARRQELVRKQRLRSRKYSTINEDAGEPKGKEEDQGMKRRRSGLALSPSVSCWKGSISYCVNERGAEVNGISSENERTYMRNKEMLMKRASYRDMAQYLELGDSLEAPVNATHASSTSNVESACKLSTHKTPEGNEYARAARAFQTDQYTLSQRLENQERVCDVAASGMNKELQMLASTVAQFASIPTSSTDHENTSYLLRAHVDILAAKAFKVSEKSVLHGYYKKEKVLAANMETVIAYIQQLQKYLNELREDYGDV